LSEEPARATARPLLTVVRGEPTDTELAALLVVLAGHPAPPAASPRRRPGAWTAKERLMRPVVAAGPGAWRTSALPR